MTEALRFGEWLKARRQELDLTREDLAERVGCASVTITKIERGQRRPSKQVAERIAEALRLPLEQRDYVVQWARGASQSAQLETPRTVSTVPAVPAQAPPPSPLKNPVNNLPSSLTSLVGRDTEISRARAILWRVDTRLMTMTGPPGIGKTRLSITVAASLHEDFRDGVCFVPLASIQDPGLLDAAITQALGIKQSPGGTVGEQLIAFLRDRQMLLVLDNFEQIVSAAPRIPDLLAAAPRVKVLVTSRALLHVYGEHEFVVPPLPLPDLSGATSPGSLELLAANPAVALFTQRAQAVHLDFELTAHNAAAVAEICVRLDGLPLAIELAAARSKLLTPQAMLPMLANRLALLTGGPHDRTDRQRTMRGAIAWSYDLLQKDEQALFCRLCTFADSFTLEAAEAVGGPAVGSDASCDIAALVASLADQSLARPVGLVGEQLRYSIPETIREYGLERLRERGDADVCARTHALYFLALAEKSEPLLQGPEQTVWLDRLGAEQPNVRSALTWALGHAEAEVAARIAGAMWRFWWTRGYWREARSWFDAVLAQEGSLPLPVRAKALLRAGVLAESWGERARAVQLFQDSLALFVALNDSEGKSAALNVLGNVALLQGDYAQARRYYEDSLALLKEIGDTRRVATTLNNLGVLTERQGDYARARLFFEEMLTLVRQLDDLWGVANALDNLGVISHKVNEHLKAMQIHRQVLELRRQIGDKPGISTSINNLGLAAIALGEYDRAESLLEESLLLRKELGDKLLIAYSLEAFGGLAAKRGQMRRSALLLGAAEALREAIGSPLPESAWAEHEAIIEAARRELGADGFEAAWQEGRAMSLDEALPYALPHASAGPPASQ